LSDGELGLVPDITNLTRMHLYEIKPIDASLNLICAAGRVPPPRSWCEREPRSSVGIARRVDAGDLARPSAWSIMRHPLLRRGWPRGELPSFRFVMGPHSMGPHSVPAAAIPGARSSRSGARVCA